MIPQAALTATSLLRGLLGTSSPSVSQANAKPQVGGTSFASLLQQAQAGAVQSGLPVTVGQDANVKLSAEQLTRLAASADIAEASGATQAIMAIDGKLLTMDVASREVTGAIEPQSGDALTSVLTEVDAFVRVPPANAGGDKQGATQTSLSRSAALLPLTSNISTNPSLLSLLSQDDAAA